MMASLPPFDGPPDEALTDQFQIDMQALAKIARDIQDRTGNFADDDPASAEALKIARAEGRDADVKKILTARTQRRKANLAETDIVQEQR